MREVICSAGKEYNTQTGRCVRTGRGACKLRLEPPVPNAGENFCDGEVNGAYFGDANYCRDFYICYENSAYAQSCDAGSLFDLATGGCVPDSDTTCWQNFCIGQNNGEMIASRSSCKAYYTCQQDEAIAASCAAGDYFSYDAQACLADENNAQCWENYCLSEPEGTTMPDPADCHSYYTCSNAGAIQGVCDTGSYFDWTTLICEVGECPDVETPTTTDDTTTDNTVATTTDDTTTEGTTTDDTTTEDSRDTTTYDTTVATSDDTTTDGTTIDDTTTEDSRDTTTDDTTDTITDDTTECTAESTPDETTECTNDSTDSTTEDTTDTTTECTAESTPDETTECTAESTPTPEETTAWLEETTEAIFIVRRARRSLAFNDDGDVTSQMDQELEFNLVDADNDENLQDILRVSTIKKQNNSNPKKTKEFVFVDAESEENLKEIPDVSSNKEIANSGGSTKTKELLFVDAESEEYLKEIPDVSSNKEIANSGGSTKTKEFQFVDAESEEKLKEIPDVSSNKELANSELENAGGSTKTKEFQFADAKSEEYLKEIPDVSSNKEIENSGGSTKTKEFQFVDAESEEYLKEIPDDSSNREIANSGGSTKTKKFQFVDAESEENLKEIPDVLSNKEIENSELENAGGSTKTQEFLFVDAESEENLKEMPKVLSSKTENIEAPNNVREFVFVDAESDEIPAVTSNNKLTNSELNNSDGFINFKEFVFIDAKSDETPEQLQTQNLRDVGATNSQTGNVIAEMPHLKPLATTSCLGIYYEGESLADADDCRKFQICTNGQLIVEDCAVGQYYDGNTGICRLDVDNVCASSKATCQGIYREGELVAHTLDCHKFQICYNGELLLQDCGAGKYFDRVGSVCQVDTKNVCPLEVSDDKAPPAAATCLGLYHEGQILAHPDDCRKYQVCLAGQLLTQDCGMGKYFDSINEICLLDTQAVCAANKPSCMDLYYEGQLIAHPLECRRFQICYNGQMHVQDCGVGKYFDSVDYICQVDTDNLCTAFMEIEAPTRQLDELTCLGLYYQGQLVPHAADCRQFQICNEGQLHTQDCGLGKYFDGANKTCQLDTYSMCDSNKPSCLGRYHEGQLVAHARDCRKFRLCYEGEMLTQDCGVGKYYNNETISCELDTENVCPIYDGNVRLLDLVADEAEDLAVAASCLGIYYEEQWVAHISDCRKYQICRGGSLLERDCGMGKYYDGLDYICKVDEQRICASNKPTCRGLYMEGERVAHSTNCRQFRVCYGGKLNLQDCGMGNYYDNETATCQLDEEKLCVVSADVRELEADSDEEDVDPTLSCLGIYREGQMLAHPEHCRKFEICHGGRLITRDCGLGHYFDGITANCQLDSEHLCQATAYEHDYGLTKWLAPDGVKTCAAADEGQLRAYKADCRQFQLCSDGFLTLGDCGTGKYFDQRTASCQLDTDRLCAAQSDVAAINNMYGAPRPLRYSHLSCYGSYEEGQLLRHPGDCSKYLLCSEGALLAQDCGLGNVYNNRTESCELDPLKKCRPKRINIKERIYQAPENAADTQVSACSNGACGSCPYGHNEGDIVVHNDCDKYFVCTGGELVAHSCGACYRFESCTGSCVLDTCGSCWPGDTNCGGELEPEPDICQGLPDGEILADPLNCAGYYVCFDGSALSEPCYPGERFNVTISECEPDVDAVCTNPCSGTTSIQYLPNPDCSKFYYCNDGVTTVKSCPDGEGFDIELGICTLDAVCESSMCVGRPDGTTYPIAGDPTKFYYCLDGVALISNCDEDQIYMADVGTCVLQPSSDCNQNYCTNVEGVSSAFPTLSNSANAFCYCRDGVAYKVYCDSDYLFDEDLGICQSTAACDAEVCKDMPDYTVSVNKNDTSSFCLCVMNEPVVVTCPNDEIFNPLTLLCQVAPTVDSRCDALYCLNQPDYTIFSALSSDAGFCVCKDGGASYTPCPTGEAFSTAYEICLPTGSYCNVEICATSTDSPFPAYNDVYSFCYCVNETTVVMRSCPNNEKFSPTLLICSTDPCDWEYCLNSANDGAFFAANNFPAGFCWCNGNTAELLTCAAGTVFNAEYGVCMPEARTG